MSNFIGMTGQGTTASFSGAGLSGCVRSLTMPDWTMEKIDATCLGSVDFKAYIPSDLTDPGEISATLVFDPSDVPDVDSLGAAGSLTITFPLAVETNTQAATFTTDGFISSLSLGEIGADNLIEVSVTYCCTAESGVSVPTFTAEAA